MATLTALCSAPLLRAALPPHEAKALGEVFKLLGDPVRLRLLSLIAVQNDGEACVCQLTKAVGLSQPTVSHHLKLLHDAGLLEREKRGAWVYYQVVAARVAALRDALALPGSRPRRKAAGQIGSG